MDAMLQLRLLGSPKVSLEGMSVAESLPNKTQAILYYLAVTGQPQSRAALATLLWGDLPETAARANLRKALIGLQQLASAYLKIDRQSVAFRPGCNLWVDVVEFEACLDHSSRPTGIVRLQAAVKLYQGNFLDGFYVLHAPDFEAWMLAQQTRLGELAIQALYTLAVHHAERGELIQGIGYTRRLLALEPWREEAQRQLMLLLARDGQRSAALAQYEICRETLAEELGVEPSVETLALYERIRVGDLSKGGPLNLQEQKSNSEPFGADPLPLASRPFEISTPRHNLPAQITPFIGREVELTELARLLADPTIRLVTILGPGGIGKTRLALEAATAELEQFSQGVYFVSLAPLSAPDQITPTIAEALKFSFYAGGSSQQQLLDYLRQKSLLLVIDNFEHLLDGAGLVQEILQAAPAIKVLATSRERLKFSGETVFTLEGLGVPEGELPDDLAPSKTMTDYSGIQFFVQHARQVRPDFELKAADLQHVIHICQLVEGLPLALLLAATWIELLSPEEIVSGISHTLDFLEADLRDVPARQRSIRAVFDHSWQLLAEPQREVFKQLSVFRGGFTHQAAQAVTGTSLQTLLTLVDKSLMHRIATNRYELHELLRQYGAEKLAEDSAQETAVRNRHSDYYLATLHHREVDLKGAQQHVALAEIERELENVRLAWNWAVEGEQVERIGPALESLGLFFRWRGRYQEGEAVCQLAAKKLAATTSGDGLRVLAQLLTWQSDFYYKLGSTNLASQLLQKSLALLDKPELADQETRPEKAFALLKMGSIERGSDLEEARRLHEQCLALYQTLGNRWWRANALAALSWTLQESGAYDQAKRLQEESLAIRQSLGDQRGIADSLSVLATIAMLQGQLEIAERLSRESNAVQAKMGDPANMAHALFELGGTLTWAGKFAEGHFYLEQSLFIYDDLGILASIDGLHANMWLSNAKLHLGHYKQARTQLQIILSQARDIGDGYTIGQVLWYLGQVSLAEEANLEARQLLHESIVIHQQLGSQNALGTNFAYLGYAYGRLGNIRQARQFLLDALRKGIEIQAFNPILKALPAIALLLAERDEKKLAVELFALAWRYLQISNSSFYEDLAGRRLSAVAATLPPEVVAVAQERGKARDLWQTANELLEKLTQPDWGQPTRVSAVTNNLPPQPTPFIGREKELADIIRRLTDKDCRLLVLVGPGGIGKTRLAFQAAQTVIDAHPQNDFFAHGILFIQLAAVSTTSGIVSAIAEAANFNFYSNVPPQQQLLDYLREKEMLLVLDNFEHLLTPVSGDGGGAELIAAILAAAPRVKILVTSREALNLQEAWFHPVKGMAFPPLPQGFSPPQAQNTDPAGQGAHAGTADDLKAYDAVQLFWQSARRAQVGFSVEVEQEHVIRICRLVEGMPLGIELAAAWLKVMPAGKIADEIERGLDILSTRLQNVPERHRNMRAVFEHSWQLLSAEERDVLQRLSVFRGSFTQAAAEQVAGASSLPTLATLVEKSLVQTTASGRYQLHELLQQFARAKLAKTAQEAATQAQHSAYYLAFLKAREQMLTGLEQRQALDDLGLEINNVRAGWRWVVEQGNLEVITQVLESLYLYYQIRGRYREGQEIFAQAAAQLLQTPAPTEPIQLETVRRMLAARQGAFCYYLGDLEAADAFLQASLSSTTPPGEAAFALGILGDIARLQGNPTLAQDHLRRSMAFSRDIGDLNGTANVLAKLSMLTTNNLGQFAEGRQLAQESLVISRRLGRPDRMGQALEALSWSTQCLGAYDETEACSKERLAISEQISDLFGIASSWHALGWLIVSLNNPPFAKAVVYYEQAIAIYRKIGHQSYLALCLTNLAQLYYEVGEYERALQYGREGVTLASEIGNLDHMGLGLCILGAVECTLGEMQASREHLGEALNIAHKIHFPASKTIALLYLGTLLVKEGDAAGVTEPVRLQKMAQALELFTLVRNYQATWQSFKDRAARLQAELELELPSEVIATARARGKSRKLEDVVVEILRETAHHEVPLA